MTVLNHIHTAFRAELVTSLLVTVFVFAMAHASRLPLTIAETVV